MKRDRPVAVTVTPAEPLPEIHVAPDVPTVLLFPANIQKKTLTVDQSRIRVRDADENSIILQAVPDYRTGERQELEVFFADKKAPARAAFVLVMDPSVVDIRIDVKRPEPPSAACPPEVQHADPKPEDFVLLGYVDKFGVPTATIEPITDNTQGLKSDPGVSYSGHGWVLFDIRISNLPGRPPFSPRGATLTGKEGGPLRARLVTAESNVSGTGVSVRVLVVADELPPSAGSVFTVEVRGDDGRSLELPRVTLPKFVTGGKQ